MIQLTERARLIEERERQRYRERLMTRAVEYAAEKRAAERARLGFDPAAAPPVVVSKPKPKPAPKPKKPPRGELYTLHGVTWTVREWAEHFDIEANSLRHSVRRHGIEAALANRGLKFERDAKQGTPGHPKNL